MARIAQEPTRCRRPGAGRSTPPARPRGGFLALGAGQSARGHAGRAGYWEGVWLRLKQDKLAIAGGVFIIFLFLVAFVGAPIAEQLLGHGPNDIFPIRRRRHRRNLLPVGPWTYVNRLQDDGRSRASSSSSAPTARSAATSSSASSTAPRSRSRSRSARRSSRMFLGVILGSIAGFFRGWIGHAHLARDRDHDGASRTCSS